MKHLLNKIMTQKLPLSFLVIIVLFISFGITTLNGLFTLGNFTKDIYEHPLVVSNASLNAALNITKMHRSMKDVIFSNSPGELKTIIKNVAEKEAGVLGELDIIRMNIIGEEGKSLEKQARELFISWKPVRQEVIRLYRSNRKQEAISITKGKGADHVAELENKMNELTAYARKKADTFQKLAVKSQAKLETLIVILTFSGIILSLFIAFFTVRRAIKDERVILNKKDSLQKALDEIKTLRGILPICSHCKQIRDDEGSWKQMEEYIHDHSEAEFTHSICPDCMQKYYPKEYASMIADKLKNKS